MMRVSQQKLSDGVTSLNLPHFSQSDSIATSLDEVAPKRLAFKFWLFWKLRFTATMDRTATIARAAIRIFLCILVFVSF